MSIVNMLEAITNHSRLVDAVEGGVETEIVIARNEPPAARLVAISKVGKAPRIGVAKVPLRCPTRSMPTTPLDRRDVTLWQWLSR